jgi:uncharacterized membrane protein
MMRNDVYSFFVSHHILKLHTFYILYNKKVWYFGERLIKFNQTWYT